MKATINPPAKLSEVKEAFLASLKSDPIPVNSDEPPKDGQVLSEREKDHFDDDCYLRHLRARQWDIPKTLAMLREYLRWRRTAKPFKVRCTEIEPHFKSSKNYHNGYSKLNQPIVYMRVRFDAPGDSEGKTKSILYQMERSIYLAERKQKQLAKKNAKSPEETKSPGETKSPTSPTSPNAHPLLTTPPSQQFVWVIDCKEFSKKNIDMAMTKEMARTLDHYCERMGVVFLTGTPTVFKFFWNIAKTFLDEKTASKVVFVDKPAAKFYANWIDEDVLEKDFGGKNTYKYDHKTYFDSVMKIENKIRKRESEKYGIPFVPVTWEEAEAFNSKRSGLVTPRKNGTEEEENLAKQVEREMDEEEKKDKK
eukprot:TRINITY_DN27145_c0_g1_i1.p1 TRINITY_DN27145_c0_g1~~TRINITY_DN27145_c0_g1_i1.p1  ORF type:complete len:365 (-),score=84.31 TRINITY_DN27145_c0_g1_i1:75-1169(-)